VPEEVHRWISRDPLLNQDRRIYHLEVLGERLRLQLRVHPRGAAQRDLWGCGKKLAMEAPLNLLLLLRRLRHRRPLNILHSRLSLQTLRLAIAMNPLIRLILTKIPSSRSAQNRHRLFHLLVLHRLAPSGDPRLRNLRHRNHPFPAHGHQSSALLSCHALRLR